MPKQSGRAAHTLLVTASAHLQLRQQLARLLRRRRREPAAALHSGAQQPRQRRERGRDVQRVEFVAVISEQRLQAARALGSCYVLQQLDVVCGRRGVGVHVVCVVRKGARLWVCV